VTQKYNREMAELLPRRGINFVEIPRLEIGGAAISAGRIRQLLREGNIDAAGELAPPTTMEYLREAGILIRLNDRVLEE
jgi:[citrate (pro-3S)-lyase] ligase